MRKTQPYESSPPLSQAISQLLALDIESLYDAHSFRDQIRIGFTTRKTLHFAGKCSKTSLPVRAETGVAFSIVVNKDEFYNMNEEDKWCVLIHELHHIDTNAKGDPAIRRHDDEFCERQAHDSYSRSVYAEIKDKLQPMFEVVEPKQTASRRKKSEDQAQLE